MSSAFKRLLENIKTVMRRERPYGGGMSTLVLSQIVMSTITRAEAKYARPVNKYKFDYAVKNIR